MRFRPCIDIHDGKVKQIVGGSLSDESGARENFVSETGGGFFGKLYREHDLRGGHIILLNKSGTSEYEATKRQAISALAAFPGGMQIGGGITAQNASEFIDYGASHVIVTSYIFTEGKLDVDKLNELVSAVGNRRIVLDLSCRYRDNNYYVVTDRWQTFTDVCVDAKMMNELSKYCDEFLIHGVDVEGMRQGIDERLLELLSKVTDIPITYAGGVKDMSDIDIIDRIGKGNIDFTIGSALDIFGGNMSFEEVCRRVQK